MRAGIRQIVGTAAAFALALQTALWGIAPVGAAQPADPFAVICHSEASASADTAPDDRSPAPAHACDHCNLCSASTPPLRPDTSFVAHVGPTRTLHVLHPTNGARHDHVVVDSRLARGPPVFA